MPLIILATLFGSLSLLSHKSTDFSFLWNMNKKSFAFIFVMVIISIDHETCLAVFYATIIYYFFYLRTGNNSMMYQIEEYKIKDSIHKSQRLKPDEDDIENSLRIESEDSMSLLSQKHTNELFNETLAKEKAIIYTFGSRFNFCLEDCHLNNV